MFKKKQKLISYLLVSIMSISILLSINLAVVAEETSNKESTTIDIKKKDLQEEKEVKFLKEIEKNSEQIKKQVKEIVKNQIDISKGQKEKIFNLINSGDENFKNLFDSIKNYANVDRTKLKEKLLQANELLRGKSQQDGNKYIKLKNIVKNATNLFNSLSPTQEDVDNQVKLLEDAINNKNLEKLDRHNLANGIYIVEGKLLRKDKVEESMANGVINHKIKIVVDDDNKYVFLELKGLQYLNNFAYLSELKYYASGYTYDKGKIKGELLPVTILKYQMNSDSSRMKDRFGSDYPKTVKLPIIKEAIEDGFIPLQIFVPIMEQIAKGNGTQTVFLQLNWDTLEKIEDGNIANEQNITDNNLPQENLQIGRGNSLLNNPNKIDNSQNDTLNKQRFLKFKNKSNKKNTKKIKVNVDNKNKNNTGKKDDQIDYVALKKDDVSNNFVNSDGTKDNSKLLLTILIPTVFGLLAIIGGISYKIYSK